MVSDGLGEVFIHLMGNCVALGKDVERDMGDVPQKLDVVDMHRCGAAQSAWCPNGFRECLPLRCELVLGEVKKERVEQPVST